MLSILTRSREMPRGDNASKSKRSPDLDLFVIGAVILAIIAGVAAFVEDRYAAQHAEALEVFASYAAAVEDLQEAVETARH